MPRKKHPQNWAQAREHFETHLLARRVSERTVYSYGIELRNLEDHLTRQGATRPGDVTLAQLRDYQCGLLTGTTSRTQRPLSAASVARIATTVRRFFAFLHDEGRLTEDPSARLERPKIPRHPPGEVLTLQEIMQLLTPEPAPTPQGVRDRTLVELLFATGLRLAEARALDLSDLDHRERQVVVRRGKGQKGRVVPLTRSAYQRVSDYVELARPDLVTEHRDSASALFLSRLGRRLSADALASSLDRLAEQVGLQKRVRPHMLRRTFATELLKANVSVRHIQLLLGHADLNTTATYLHLDTRELRRELLLKHPRERFEV